MGASALVNIHGRSGIADFECEIEAGDVTNIDDYIIADERF